MKTILITGGAGFIAHHIVDYFLKNTDSNIILLDRLDYSGNLNRISNLLDTKYNNAPQYKRRVKFVYHDLKAEINSMLSTYIGDVNIVLHLAAGSHVDRSIDNPLEFVQDNVVGTCNILNYARGLKNLEKFLYFSTDEVFGSAPFGINYNERDRYNSTNPYSASKAGAEELCVAFENTYKMPIIITHCHDEETLCWSEKGIVSINELSIGDNVWTLKDNKELKLEPIEEIVVSDYKGEMIGFKSKKFDLNVTPNHRMLTQKRYGENIFSIKYAKDILDNIKDNERHYIPTSGEWVGIDEAIIDISNFIDVTNLHFNTNNIEEKYDTLDFMAFIGWFVSEGSLGTINKGCISIANTNNVYRNEIISLLNRMKFNISNNINNQSWKNIQINSVIFQKFIEDNFGRGCENKKIPDWILKYDKKYLKVLLDCLMKGDGSITESYKRYYSKSKKLCEQVAEIAIKLGYSAQVKERTTNTKKLNGIDKDCISYYTNIRESFHSTLEKRNITTSQYNGKIWCIRTKSGNFFVSRNGQISCSGNTMNVVGERQHPEKFVPMCIRKIINGETITIHSNKEKTKAGSRFYIHALDVADALYFILTQNPVSPSDYGGASCPKYNIVGYEELDNLELATIIANSLEMNLNYEFVDFHSSRPGHDLRYALSGELLKSQGWQPQSPIAIRVKEIVDWYKENPEWLEL